MELGIKDVQRILFRRWWIIVLLAIVGGTGVGFYSYGYIQPVYEASARMVVHSAEGNEEGTPQLTLNALNAQMQLVNTYKELVRTPWIMDEVAAAHPEFGLTGRELAGKISVGSVPNTQIMFITVSDGEYRKAAEIANAVTEVFISKIPELYQLENVRVVGAADEGANLPQVKPNPVFNIIVAIILSLLLGVGIALLLEYWDETFESEADVERYVGLPTLAVIRAMRHSDLETGHTRLLTGRTAEVVSTNAPR